MVYINKITHIPSDTFDSFENEYMYFECDDLIAPTIHILLNKGYKTDFCCQGHYYEYHYEYDNEYNPVLLHVPGYDVPYITFQKPYIPNFKDLDKGWKIDSEFTYEHVLGIYYEDFPEPEKITFFDYNKKILQVMEDLYNWAKNLPEYKEDD